MRYIDIFGFLFFCLSVLVILFIAVNADQFSGDSSSDRDNTPVMRCVDQDNEQICYWY